MTHPPGILSLTVLAAVGVLLPLRAAAQSGTVTDDAFLSSNATTQQLNLNGHGIVLIVAGSSATVGPLPVGLTKSYIKFQLQSSLPIPTAAANVQKATLKLFISPSCSPTGAIDIYPATSPWSESALNPSSPPTLASTPLNSSPIPVGTSESFVVIDLTQLVQEWLNGSANGGLDNDGIALVANTSTTNVVFDSKESIVTSHEPRLEIVLANSGPPGAAATIAIGTTTTLGPTGQAAVTNSGTPSAAILNFAIPQGQPGATGQTGAPGTPGAAATVQVGTVMGVPYNQPASVLNGGTPNAAVLNFLIPQGQPGTTGAQGPQGPIGINSRGQWSSAPTYGPNDAVFDSASFWLATAANTNSEPSPTNTNWQLLAGGIVNRGAWSASNSYNVDDAVSDGGSYWLALAQTSANTATPNTSCQPSLQPACAADWQLLAAKGDTGPQGQTGAAGAPGQSVAGSPEPSGPNCAYGGTKFVAANGTTYACNGVPGVQGAQGPPGPQGPAGTLTSFNSLSNLPCSIGGLAGTITIDFASSGVASLTCNVLAASSPPDFAISASSALNITQGSSTTTTISVTPQNGFAGAVALSASGLPSGVTAAFNPASTTNGGTLTLTATNAAALGTVTVTVTGTSGGLSHSVAISLTVNATPPPIAPPNSTPATAVGLGTLLCNQSVLVSANLPAGYSEWYSVSLNCEGRLASTAFNLTTNSAIQFDILTGPPFDQTTTVAANTTSARIQLPILGSVTYYIRVHGATSSDAGTWNLSVLVQGL